MSFRINREAQPTGAVPASVIEGSVRDRPDQQGHGR